MEKRNYSRLSLIERVKIETFLNEKRSKTYIAEKLARSRSTISREINKWIDKPDDPYNATLAQWHADDEKINKRNQTKLSLKPKLKIQVYRWLLNRLSPEAISGRLRLLFPDDADMHISHEAIYMHIYAHRQAKLTKKLKS